MIYDRKGRDFPTIYNTGCCYSTVAFRTTNVNALVGDTSQLKWEGDDVCLNQWVDITDQASFNSLNGMVAKLTLEPGQLLHPSAGTTTVNTQVFYFRFHPDECAGVTAFGSCSVRVRPQVTGVTPPRGLIGAVTSVTISGLGFGNTPTVNAGSGVTVNITSASDTIIQANFNVSSTAPAGNHQVTVTAGGQASQQSVNFFVQVPTSLSVLLDGVSSTKHPNPLPNGCPTTNYSVFGPYGMSILVKYQVMDQASQPVQAQMQLREDLVDFFVDGARAADDALNLLVTLSGSTDTDGTFQDDGVGACGQGAFGNATFKQKLFLVLWPGNRTDVRLNNFSQTGTHGCGSSSNGGGGDISVSVSCP